MCNTEVDHHKILGKRLNKSQGKNPKNKTGITTTVCKCDRCGLVYSNPQPVPFDLQDHYGIPPENYWKKEYFTINQDYFKGEIEKLHQLMDFKTGMKSLDIGAGIGKQMTVLSRIGFDTYGLEPSRPFYDRALSQMGIDPNKLKFDAIETVEYPDSYFDFISFGVVLEHIYDPSKSIKKALKWLKPGGIIHIEVPSSNWLTNRIINLFYKLRLTDYVGNISPMHEPFHLYEFGLKSFENHASVNNYNIVFHEYYICKTFLPRVLDFILKPIMKWTKTGMQLCVWLRKPE